MTHFLPSLVLGAVTGWLLWRFLPRWITFR
jgi:hypothetical protein